MDRISDVPDEILHHIGSFLSAKEAAFATLLSKRWRTLFTIIPKSVAHLHVQQEDVSRILRIEYWLYLSALASGHSLSNVNMSLGTKTLSTLKRLTIRRREWFSYDETDEDNTRVDSRCLTHEFDNVSFHTPALTYLEYSDYVPKEYLTVNLNSLVEANLNLWVDEEGVWRPYHATTFNPMTLINGLKNVAILSLTSEAVELSLGLSERCWFSLTNVIKKFPNLKTLIIESILAYCLVRWRS
ncbi:hypothetical protein BRARA_D01077 [Brassica rapa]|uniref:F-box domain-containing protein n=1 Tax=Brassica campestris TaxID=3711 RepID=A0A397ZKK7_BRACM|nr:hypothetical protein BRARA_D01077 [Brassica rapa]